MDNLMAIVSPQNVIMALIEAVEARTNYRSPLILQGAVIDHVGFVQDASNFSNRREAFLRLVSPRSEFRFPEGGNIIFGTQLDENGLTWYPHNVLPALALVAADVHFPVPEGGAYVAVRYFEEKHAAEALKRMHITYEDCTLFGEKAFRFAGYSPLGENLYWVYVLFHDSREITRLLAMRQGR